MNEDMSKVFKQLSDMLGQGNSSDNLNNLVTMLENMIGSQPSGNNTTGETKNQTESNTSGIDMDTMMKITQIMSRIGNNNDPRANLLKALKPYLNKKRQEKVEQCIKFLSISEILQLLNNAEGGEKQHD